MDHVGLCPLSKLLSRPHLTHDSVGPLESTGCTNKNNPLGKFIISVIVTDLATKFTDFTNEHSGNKLICINFVTTFGLFKNYIHLNLKVHSFFLSEQVIKLRF